MQGMGALSLAWRARRAGLRSGGLGGGGFPVGFVLRRRRRPGHQLERCSLREVDFTGADCRGVVLRDCDLSGARLVAAACGRPVWWVRPDGPWRLPPVALPGLSSTPRMPSTWSLRWASRSWQADPHDLLRLPDAGPAFYEGLEADNSKTYWLAHKAVYESAIREPMLALVDALEGEFGDTCPAVPRCAL